MKADCWAPGGGSEGKGPRGRKGKETAAKASPEAETDEVWMVNAESNVQCYALEVFVNKWRTGIQNDGEMLWDAAEIMEETSHSNINAYETYIDECTASLSNNVELKLKSPPVLALYSPIGNL